MSLRIIKAGLLDSLQDNGRYGFAHLGLGAGGAMDPFSSRQANALLGNALDEAVIELHQPAASFLFQDPAAIALCGGDFQPSINGQPVPMDHPLLVPAGSTLRFEGHGWGARCYLGLMGGFSTTPWLGSASTQFRAGRGGCKGRALLKDDELVFRKPLKRPVAELAVLPWKAGYTVPATNEVQVLIGPEWSLLDAGQRSVFQEHWFALKPESDRMGYRLHGAPMPHRHSLLSSAVSFGTVQWLPDGQLLVLMADHQTTGGYPRIAQVITAHLPILAQRRPGDALRFHLTDLATAEEKLMKQQQYLEDIREAAGERMRELGFSEFV